MATTTPGKEVVGCLPEKLQSPAKETSETFPEKNKSPAKITTLTSPGNPATPSSHPGIPSTPSTTSVYKAALTETDAKEISVTIPSYARWFSWKDIHETERRAFVDFFNGKFPSRNPRVYKYYRNSIIRKYREKPSRKITFTEIRRNLIGDVGSIRKVFDFLEAWGLINYTGTVSKQNLKWEEREYKSVGVSTASPSSADSTTVKKICGSCKAICSMACFSCEKPGINLILCARCFVRSNYQVGLSSGDFRRVDISEESKTEWTEKETLHLLEAVLQYGDDWKKVSEHVGGRNEKECVVRFIKLPFSEQYLGTQGDEMVDNDEDVKYSGNAQNEKDSILSSSIKKRRLSPLADVSNPIMAQAAFLSALAGPGIALTAANAAVAALSQQDLTKVEDTDSEKIFTPGETDQQDKENVEKNGAVEKTMEWANTRARALLEKEKEEVEQSIANLINVQMKEIQKKIAHFEELELLLEKEWSQLNYMKNLLFVDQLTLIRQQKTLPKSPENKEKVNNTDDVTITN